ncbi:MAG: aminocarboxymuconate-semialdehyde decarboxylase, partial [Betaproteobacteria bacterium]|nr:aminocarboxymuconate-semialdehyde decarboxylase [Betaproteobacteria bacterium]
MNPRAGSIDAHAHWAPEAYVRYLTELGRPAAGGPLSPLMFDLEKRLTWMDERHIGMHVLTLSGAMPWQWASQEQANKLARIVNDAAIDAHKAFPDRFLAGIAMPMRDPAAALRELDRVAGEPGIRAVHLPNSLEGRDYIFEPA